ncbi:MAG: 30S ribosomal protein S8 [Candidatus Hydrogenedentes bacterium]|nr:30S ribosomal protein S8 [Candidatus Hydrogenedentota bacterium]
MSMTDPIADLLTRIRNASSARHEKVDVPASNLKEQIARILKREGYIADYRRIEDNRQGVLRIYLKYETDRKPAISVIERISKPGRRQHVKATEVPRVIRGLGIAILSTSSGVMTDKEARAANVGGEVLCYVW